MKKHRKELALALSNITQLGISAVVSFFIWILIANWVRNTFALGNYVTVIGIFLGAGSAGLSFYNFSKKISNITSKEEDNES